MKEILCAICVLAALSGTVVAEVVVTTDGRRIDLNDDGTYKILADEVVVKIAMIEQSPFFEYFSGEYGQNSMRFMPIFKSGTEKTIVGFKFRSEFKSAFGEEVFSFAGESSEKVEAGLTSTAATFYFFEDNQFISGEPFDKLKIFEAAGTGKILSKVTTVVFEDGEILKYKN